jgi:hypothetical protein
MAGKYAHLVDKLPKLVSTDAKYQDKIEAVKKEILAEHNADWLPASTLAKDYTEIRIEIDTLEGMLSKTNMRLEAVTQMMINQFEVEDVSSLRITGASIRTQVEPYAQVKDKAAFRKWCIANGLEESLSLPWPSTNSITKERLLAGLPEPDGVEAYQKTKVVLTRDK